MTPTPPVKRRHSAVAARPGRRLLGARLCGVALILASILACTSGPAPDLRIAWTPVEALNAELPAGIRVFAGADPSIPLRAWYVRVDEQDEDVVARISASTDIDGVETASEFADRTMARVVVNGGFFRMDRDPATHVGLLLVDHRLVESPLNSVIRAGERYFVSRAALGLTANGAPDVAWVSGRDAAVYERLDPLPNRPSAPMTESDTADLQQWAVRDAVAGGPALVMGGEVRITVDEEVFFGSTIPEVHPRTAAGVTADGDLVLLVVDGRQRDSRGVGLHELATLMRDLGCEEALNLDGGASSTLVVDGVLVNRPVGGDRQREIMSALTILETTE